MGALTSAALISGFTAESAVNKLNVASGDGVADREAGQPKAVLSRAGGHVIQFQDSEPSADVVGIRLKKVERLG